MHSSCNKPTFLASTALALVVTLTGCGGGGSDANVAPKPASAEMVASFNSIAQSCGEETRLPTATPSAGHTNRLLYSMLRGRDSQDVSNIFTTGGSEAVNDIMSVLKVGVRDWRGITTGAYVDVGSALPGAGMGIQMRPTMASASIACVKSVSWLKSPPYSPLTPTLNSPIPERTLFWTSREQATLPIGTLGSYPVDGFELVGNFIPASGVAFFSVTKGDVADPSAIQICVLPNQGGTWSCSLPKISDDTNRWTFSVGGARPGVYMLTSSHRESHF